MTHGSLGGLVSGASTLALRKTKESDMAHGEQLRPWFQRPRRPRPLSWL
jgi:hypothetical protein